MPNNNNQKRLRAQQPNKSIVGQTKRTVPANRNIKPVSATSRGQQAKTASPLKRTLSMNDVKNIRASFILNDRKLMDAVATIPFSQLMGLPYEEIRTAKIGLSEMDYPIYSNSTMSIHRVPTVMGLYFSPSFSDANSLTLAARALYAKVRAKNAGGYNYDAPDLMYYQIQTASLAAVYFWYVRIYAILGLYSERNRGFPKHILNAMGITDVMVKELQANKAQFYSWLQIARRKINAIYIPQLSGLLLRWMQINSKLYLDSPSKNASIYVTNMRHFYLYDEPHNALILSDALRGCKGSKTPSGIGHVPMFSTMTDWRPGSSDTALRALTKHFDAAIESITNSTSIALMSGDCQKVFGPGFIIPEIPQDYVIVPEYDPLFLDQIRNTTVLPFGGISGDGTGVRPIVVNTDGAAVEEFDDVTEFLIPEEFGYGGNAYYYPGIGALLQSKVNGTIAQSYIFSIPAIPDSANQPNISVNLGQHQRAVLNVRSDNPDSADVLLSTRNISLLGVTSYEGNRIIIADNNMERKVYFPQTAATSLDMAGSFTTGKPAIAAKIVPDNAKYFTIFTSGSEFCYAMQVVGSPFNTDGYNTSINEGDTTWYFMGDYIYAPPGNTNVPWDTIFSSVAYFVARMAYIDTFDSHPAVSFATSSKIEMDTSVATPMFTLRDTYHVTMLKPAILKNLNVAALFSQCNFGDSY